MIEFHQVHKTYRTGGREIPALQPTQLEIASGEVFGLIGHSGAGKSTLLRLINRLEEPSGGRILVNGEDVTALDADGLRRFRQRVGMIFQHFNLLMSKTVADNVAMPLRLAGIRSRSEIDARVASLLDRVGLKDHARKYPAQLSGGQKQRVALARSLVKKPKMLLLDEPLGALDKNLRTQTQFELMNIQEETGITFVIVTHDQEEAMTVSSRIAVMDHGRIVQVSTPGELYEAPRSRYVADFIGEVNILEGRSAQREGDHLVLQCQEAGCAVQTGPYGQESGEGPLWIALRPEKVRISKEPPADTSRNCMAGEVWDIGYLGNLSTYHVKLDSGKMITATQANMARLIERPITWEDRVYLTWAPDAAVVLRD